MKYVCIFVIFFCAFMLHMANNTIDGKNNIITSLMTENVQLFDTVDSLTIELDNIKEAQKWRDYITKSDAMVVYGTMYEPTVEQCDEDPDTTADNTKFCIERAGSYKYIAASRDLFEHFEFGDKVLVLNAGKHSGVWELRDVMNARWTDRIDFLQDIGSPWVTYENVIILKYEEH